MRRTRVDRDRAHHPCVVHEGGSGSGVRRSGSKGQNFGHTTIQDTMTVTISFMCA